MNQCSQLQRSKCDAFFAEPFHPERLREMFQIYFGLMWLLQSDGDVIVSLSTPAVTRLLGSTFQSGVDG